MRINEPDQSLYDNRIKRLQAELADANIDIFVGYSSETESGTSRYLAGFWPFFDFCGVAVPVKGEPALITGGPESYEFAKKFSKIRRLEINPLFVESSAPEWVPQVEGKNFSEILPSLFDGRIRRIGIGNSNIFPFPIMDDLRKAAPEAEFLPVDELLLKVQSVKDSSELVYVREAYKITETAMRSALESVRPGMQEWEAESIARRKMIEMGAEGMPYPSWVCSGPSTKLSLCRSTDRVIRKNELVQFTFGAKYMGYCGNMCRPFVIGKAPSNVKKLMDVCLEATEFTLEAIRPGVQANSVFKGYHSILSKYGFENFTLYGPAHGTGHTEVEGLWLSANADFTIRENMLFNIDIWLSDGEIGMRFEEGVLVSEDGLELLNPYRREAIEL